MTSLPESALPAGTSPGPSPDLSPDLPGEEDEDAGAQAFLTAGNAYFLGTSYPAMLTVPSMRSFALFAFVALATVSIGCSAAEDLNPLPTTNGRCDFRPKKPQCTDLRNYKAAVPAQTVMQGICVEGTTAAETCPTDGMLGGCQSDSGSGALQTNWYYSGDKYKTVDDVKKQCTDDKATYVGPS